MTIQVGDRIPAGNFTTMTADGPAKLSTEELLAGKTVVLVSVPGAFTPTCSARHLPGFVDHIDAIKASVRDDIKTDDHPIGAILVQELEKKVVATGLA